MAKFLSFASGWKKDNGKIGCAAGGDNCSLFDPETKTSDKMKLKMNLLDTVTGETLEVTNFYIKESEPKTSEKGRPLPTHQLIVVIDGDK